MRATLEQLKAMGTFRLFCHWFTGRFPFDAARCGECLTQHELGHCHPEIGIHIQRMIERATVKDVALYGRFVRQNLEELYALRLFYDSLYPQTVEATPTPTEAVCLPSVPIERWV